VLAVKDSIKKIIYLLEYKDKKILKLGTSSNVEERIKFLSKRYGDPTYIGIFNFGNDINEVVKSEFWLHRLFRTIEPDYCSEYSGKNGYTEVYSEQMKRTIISVLENMQESVLKGVSLPEYRAKHGLAIKSYMEGTR
jgi:hypothetical protein